jgi:sugar (pentulose or hexulose) kinase
MYYVLGAILSAGLALRWLRNILGMRQTPDAYTILSAEAALVSPGAGGLIFLPYLSGERTPHMDPLARASFVGLGLHHTRAHLARAVMEGVSFALRQALEISLTLSGPVDTVIVAGGGAESDIWRQIQADVFGLPQGAAGRTNAVGATLVAESGRDSPASKKLAPSCPLRFCNTSGCAAPLFYDALLTPIFNVPASASRPARFRRRFAGKCRSPCYNEIISRIVFLAV